MSKAEPF